ncbi:hypothetical protein GCM10022251_74320 [Phytohabitans flavus]|uniref:hypothetical protein n=1 Tax=Phytohabitans flavus TaxID=1076124 RepID=UPI0031EEFB66
METELGVHRAGRISAQFTDGIYALTAAASGTSVECSVTLTACCARSTKQPTADVAFDVDTLIAEVSDQLRVHGIEVTDVDVFDAETRWNLAGGPATVVE